MVVPMDTNVCYVSHTVQGVVVMTEGTRCHGVCVCVCACCVVCMCVCVCVCRWKQQ